MRSGGKLRRLAARWCSEVLADQGQALLHPAGGGQPQPGHYAQHKSRPAERALLRYVCANVGITHRGRTYIQRAVAVDTHAFSSLDCGKTACTTAQSSRSLAESLMFALVLVIVQLLSSSCLDIC